MKRDACVIAFASGLTRSTTIASCTVRCGAKQDDARSSMEVEFEVTSFFFSFFYVRDWRKAMNQQNDRPGTPATSQLPTHMRGKGIRTG